jgi:hypothetical protein
MKMLLALTAAKSVITPSEPCSVQQVADRINAVAITCASVKQEGNLQYCIPHRQNNQKNIHTNNKTTTRMALTSWTEYHESHLSMNKPWVEKLKKQSHAAFGLVNNPEGIMTTVTAAIMTQADLEHILLLLPARQRQLECFTHALLQTTKFGESMELRLLISHCGYSRTKACEKKLSMEAFASR